MAEMFNSAIERLVDRVSTDIHPLSGQAKDLGLGRGVHRDDAVPGGLAADRLGQPGG